MRLANLDDRPVIVADSGNARHPELVAVRDLGESLGVTFDEVFTRWDEVRRWSIVPPSSSPRAWRRR